jgi:methionine-R-sulfoxide reductase
MAGKSCNIMSKSIVIIIMAMSLLSCRPSAQTSQYMNKNEDFPVQKSDTEWRRLLTPEQFSVLREKATERPFTGKYYLTDEHGIYTCAACGNELFRSDDKFDAGCGWPSFSEQISQGNILTQPDSSHGMIRTEILCARCGGHLGHLFDDGPKPTGQRYCVNSASLNFIKQK